MNIMSPEHTVAALATDEARRPYMNGRDTTTETIERLKQTIEQDVAARKSPDEASLWAPGCEPRPWEEPAPWDNPGTETERNQIADALESIAAVPVRYNGVAVILRAFFGDDTAGLGRALFDRWIECSVPDVLYDDLRKIPNDYGVDPPRQTGHGLMGWQWAGISVVDPTQTQCSQKRDQPGLIRCCAI